MTRAKPPPTSFFDRRSFHVVATSRNTADRSDMCVVVCPEHAIVSGDMNDPDSEISKILAKNNLPCRHRAPGPQHPDPKGFR